MNYRNECPECESRDTEKVHVEWFSDGVEEVRICNDCPTQYTNEWYDPLKRVDTTGKRA